MATWQVGVISTCQVGIISTWQVEIPGRTDFYLAGSNGQVEIIPTQVEIMSTYSYLPPTWVVITPTWVEITPTWVEINPYLGGNKCPLNVVLACQNAQEMSRNLVLPRFQGVSCFSGTPKRAGNLKNPWFLPRFKRFPCFSGTPERASNLGLVAW